jgi:YD repeat-containing protein
MGRSWTVTLFLLALFCATSSAFAGPYSDWSPDGYPQLYWEWRVEGSSGSWFHALDDACNDYVTKVVAPEWIGRPLTSQDGEFTDVKPQYFPPDDDEGIVPPGQCRALLYVSINGGPDEYWGNNKYFFSHRGQYSVTVPQGQYPQLGVGSSKGNSRERDNTSVGEPINITTGNNVHVESIVIGSGEKAIHFSRVYNSQGTAGVFGANWHSSFSRTIEMEQLPVPWSPPGTVVSSDYTTPEQGCADGWYEIRGSIDQAWAADSSGHLTEEGDCLIIYDNGQKVYGRIPLFSDVAHTAYVASEDPILAARLTRPDGSNFTLTQSGVSWFDEKGILDRLEELKNAAKIRTGWRYTTDQNTIETYDADGRLLSIETPNGVTQTLTYDSAARLENVTNDAGYSLSFSYDSQDRVITMTDHTGRVWAYGYDQNNNLAYVNQPDGTSRRYHYGDSRFPHALTGITDERGILYLSYAYDSQGRAVMNTMPGDSGRVDIDYDDVNMTRTVTNGDSVSTTYSINVQTDTPLITRVDGPGCDTCNNGSVSASFDGITNYLLSETQDGVTTQYGNYDAQGNPGYKITDVGTSHARTTYYTYDSRYLSKITSVSEISVASGRQKVTRYEYDDFGNLVRETVSGFTPNGTSLPPRVTIYEYDGPYHQLSRVDGPRADVNDVTTYAYDAKGNLVKITDALGHTTLISDYDDLGRPLTIMDPNGLGTHLTYDTLGRLVSRDVGGETTVFSYDPVGNLTRTTMPDGSYIAYDYDDAHRLIGISDQLGNRIAYTLDSRGNRIKEDRYDPDNHLTMTQSRVYNDLNKLIEDVGARGQVTAYGYNANGKRSSVTDPLSHSTYYYYDIFNNLNKVTDALNDSVLYSHDLSDNLTQVDDPLHYSTHYVYDDYGDLLQVSSPDSGVTSYTYDEAGNLLSKIDADGNTTAYAYDALNRLTHVSYADGSTAIYTYDDGSNGIGRLVGLADSTGRTQWGYDPHGRLVEKQEVIGSVTLVTRYTYDSYGRLAEMVYPSGNTLSYSYTNGQISAMAVNGRPLISDIRYQPFGPVTAWTWGNGIPMMRGYDQDGRLTNLTLAGDVRTLSYDLDNRLTALLDNNNDMTFDYDALDRLTQVTGGPADQSFQYDANGNRIKLTQGLSDVSYVYVSGTNRLAGYDGVSPKSYTYDANGSPTGDGVHSYKYDARNRL